MTSDDKWINLVDSWSKRETSVCFCPFLDKHAKWHQSLRESVSGISADLQVLLNRAPAPGPGLVRPRTGSHLETWGNEDRRSRASKLEKLSTLTLRNNWAEPRWVDSLITAGNQSGGGQINVSQNGSAVKRAGWSSGWGGETRLQESGRLGKAQRWGCCSRSHGDSDGLSHLWREPGHGGSFTDSGTQETEELSGFPWSGSWPLTWRINISPQTTPFVWLEDLWPRGTHLMKILLSRPRLYPF